MKKVIIKIVIAFISIMTLLMPSYVLAETEAEEHVFNYTFTNLDDSFVQQYFELTTPGNGSPETGYIISNEGNGSYFRVYIEGYYGKYTSSGFDESQALYKIVPELEIKDIIINGKSYGSFMDAEDEEPCEIVVEGVTESDMTWSDYPVSVTRWGDAFEFEFNNVLSTTDIDVEVVFAGKAHVHALTPTAAKDATCTEAGNIAYWTCSDCGAIFSDEAGTTEINQADTVIPAKGHALTKTEAKKATCTEPGNIEYWTCSECQKLFKEEAGTTEIQQADTVVAAKSHNPVATALKRATDKANGNTAYWSCSVCGKFFSDAACTNEIAKDSWIIQKSKMKVTAKKPTAKAKKKTVIKKTSAFTVKNAPGKLTFKKASGNSKITVGKTGKVTVKKGLKKGKTYSVKVKVTSAKTSKYAAITKTVTLKIKIK